MKHMLMNPAFPDIVGEWAHRRHRAALTVLACSANDNDGHIRDELSDPLLTALAKMEIAATRLW